LCFHYYKRKVFPKRSEILKIFLTPQILSETVYHAVLTGDAKLNKALERWLVIDVPDTEISDEKMKIMLKDIDDKKAYKHGLLDYLVYLIKNSADIQHLHQEIARYLGMDKYHLNRIYKTVDGNHVRSKSEVIICDLLANGGIKYEYERALEYEPRKKSIPTLQFILIMEKNFIGNILECLVTKITAKHGLKSWIFTENIFLGGHDKGVREIITEINTMYQ